MVKISRRGDKEKGAIQKNGAEGGIRTRTGVAHYPLKIACLPVPPLRQQILKLFGNYAAKYLQLAITIECNGEMYPGWAR